VGTTSADSADTHQIFFGDGGKGKGRGGGILGQKTLCPTERESWKKGHTVILGIPGWTGAELVSGDELSREVRGWVRLWGKKREKTTHMGKV